MCEVCEAELTENTCPICRKRKLCSECSLDFAGFKVCVYCHYALNHTGQTVESLRGETK
jgi:hypothetical protein